MIICKWKITRTIQLLWLLCFGHCSLESICYYKRRCLNSLCYTTWSIFLYLFKSLLEQWKVIIFLFCLLFLQNFKRKYVWFKGKIHFCYFLAITSWYISLLLFLFLFKRLMIFWWSSLKKKIFINSCCKLK